MYMFVLIQEPIVVMIMHVSYTSATLFLSLYSAVIFIPRFKFLQFGLILINSIAQNKYSRRKKCHKLLLSNVANTPTTLRVETLLYQIKATLLLQLVPKFRLFYLRKPLYLDFVLHTLFILSTKLCKMLWQRKKLSNR